MSSGEQVEARDKMRSQIYAELYKTTYNYGAQSARATAAFDLDDPLDESVTPVDPKQRAFSTKPYVPPTALDETSSKPFGNVLDAPLG